LVTLYVVSAGNAAGKTTICAGLGKHLLLEGNKVGFFKPIIADKKPGDDSDALFMKEALSLSEPLDSISPLLNNDSDPSGKMKEAFARIAQDKDVVIVEGICGETPGDTLSKAAYEVAGTLKARVIVIESYSPSSGAEFINSYKGFAGNLLGVIVNKIPESQLQSVSDELSSRFAKAGINVLGMLPEDRRLSTISIGELSEHIQGEILNNAEKSSELIENLMLGAMCVDSGLDYFGRKADKAVVIRDDRPDMQLAALETSTRCLIISGDTPPIHSVLYRAGDKGVPIIITKSDAGAILENITDAMSSARFHHEKKLPRLAEIMEQQLDLAAISNGLGLAK